MPLTLTDFRATQEKNKIKLTWHTVAEVNVSYFEIEKSTNGIQYSSIAKVSAANNPGTHDYETYDPSPENGINYYRLKMVDIDGAFKHSNIINLRFNSTGPITIIYRIR